MIHRTSIRLVYSRAGEGLSFGLARHGEPLKVEADTILKQPSHYDRRLIRSASGRGPAVDPGRSGNVLVLPAPADKCVEAFWIDDAIACLAGDGAFMRRETTIVKDGGSGI